MLDVTVRTLDSQNHPFSVEDEMTVAEFKQHIASTVNISADVQRIIYCGRILRDESKLKDLDLHGKVVHLVQRLPPPDNQANDTSRGASNNAQSQRNMPGNTMYFGSIEIPWDAEQVLPPPPPAHSLAGSRLNCARAMLRRAENAIALLENPSGNTNTSSNEENQEETSNNSTHSASSVDNNFEIQNEGTVFEARVVIPATTSPAGIQQAIINAIQSSLGPNSQNIDNTQSQTTAAANNSTVPQEASPVSQPQQSAEETASTTPTSEANPADSTPTTNATRSDNPERSNLRPDTFSRTSEMADLLDTLSRLHIRFAPFLETYRNFMRDDPEVEAADVRRIQVMMTRVSEVLHLLGHAYHSLSDIILNVRMPPSRPLLCRPILIQNVIEADIPIQVEAQINLLRPGTTPTANGTTNSDATTPNETEAGEPTTGTGTATGSPLRRPVGHITVTPQVEFMNVPMYPVGGMHVHSSIPWNVTGMRNMRPVNITGGVGSGGSTANANSNANGATNADNSTPSMDTNQGTAGNGRPINVQLSNRDIQFFTESFTIDSVDGANNPDGNRGEASMNLIQSLMQIAGQLVNRANVGASSGARTTTTGSATDSSQPSSASATTQSNQTTAGQTGQNSQARGNTQTHPTTATYTRSTARPHVHSTHTFHRFDPFLPCNSHHIQCRRRPNGTASGGQQATATNVRGATAANVNNPILNAIQGVLSSLQNVYNRRPTDQPTSGSVPSAAPGSAANAANADVLNSVFANLPNIVQTHLQNLETVPGNSDRGPTIAQILEQAGDQGSAEGIIGNAIMLISRSFTISDILEINAGRLHPLWRISPEIRTFVLEEVLERNGLNSANVERAANRVIGELQPIFDHLGQLELQNDIDLVASLQRLIRLRLPTILNLSLSRNRSSTRYMLNHIFGLFKNAISLILFASANGQQGVEQIIQRIVASYMEGRAPHVQMWITSTINGRLQRFARLQALQTPANQQQLATYIVRNVDTLTAESDAAQQSNEPMDVDMEVSGESQVLNSAGGSAIALGPIDTTDSSEDMPSVVIGSEPWHDQVPPDWVPIIARDAQRQRRQNNVAFSDAYLSGMPTKRRKVINNSKPQGSLPQVITESLRRAVNTCGLSGVQNAEAVADEAGTDLNIQSAYRELLRTSVQSSVQDNEDFTPERFPNATAYFGKSQQ